jgi:hypothetical protein
MSDKKKPYDLLVIEEFEHNGEQRRNYHRVGVAFENKESGFTAHTYPGVSVSGRFLILPRKDKPEDDSEG